MRVGATVCTSGVDAARALMMMSSNCETSDSRPSVETVNWSPAPRTSTWPTPGRRDSGLCRLMIA
jgi:hypothetical protein